MTPAFVLTTVEVTQEERDEAPPFLHPAVTQHFGLTPIVPTQSTVPISEET